MELLQSPEDRGYPGEYLLARLCGRRERFIKNWEVILLSDNPYEHLQSVQHGEMLRKHPAEDVWRRLAKEFIWVYMQMNNDLRMTFNPLFAYFEIKTLVSCFRYKIKKADKEAMESLLSYSLLSEKIKKILTGGMDMVPALEVIEGLFERHPGLIEIFSTSGLKGVEERLNVVFLEDTVRSELHPVIKTFFTYVIDFKNILAVYKYRRWGISDEPLFIKGGGIEKSRLKKAVYSDEISTIRKLFPGLSKISINTSSAADIENKLLTVLTRHLRTSGREPSGIGFILNYLWRCYLEALNLGIILQGRNVEPSVIKEEIVL